MPTRERKSEYFQRMTVMLDTYSKILLVHADHVGSQQFHQIRASLRSKAEVLMGKNTLIRKVITNFLKEHENHPIESLLPFIKGNIGLIFTNDDFSDIRQTIDDNRVPAAAKANVVAECDVVVPPGPTGCDPGQTGWFQALNVPTKISRGQIEIVSELKLISKGTKVGASQAALLQKLNIKPFTYGLVLKEVYDNGKVFDAKVLDITSEDLSAKFVMSLRRMSCIEMSIGVVSEVSLGHVMYNSMKRLIAVCAASEYSFKEMEEWEKLLKMDPEELKKMQSCSGGAKEEEKKEEVVEEEEEVDVGGGNLFGDDDDDDY